MKILFPYMARWNSAHASRYFHLLTAVADQGHEVYVIQPPSRGSGEANDIDVPLSGHHRVHVTTVPMPQVLWTRQLPFEKLLKKLLYTLKSWRTVRRLTRTHRIDLWYLYNLPQAVYLLGTHPAVVFDLADDLLGMLQMEMSISSRHPAYRLARGLLHWIYRRSDFVICISGPLYESIDHPRRFIIPNGAPAAPVRAGERDAEPGKKGRRLRVGYVGAFEYSMALDQIVEVAARMREADFVLVGAGREFPRIRAEVERRGLRNVTLTGALPHAEAMKVIRAVDICLNVFNKTPVSHAVSPLKLFEYLSFQKPVISTRLKEVERIDGGFLFFGDTVDEIVERIQYIACHEDKARQLAELGAAVVRKRYSWDVLAAQFISAVHTSCPRLLPGVSPENF